MRLLGQTLSHDFGHKGFAVFDLTQNSHKYSRTVTNSRLLRQRNLYQNARNVVSRLPVMHLEPELDLKRRVMFC